MAWRISLAATVTALDTGSSEPAATSIADAGTTPSSGPTRRRSPSRPSHPGSEPTAFIAPTSWTGFYPGVFGGAAAGRTDIGLVGYPSSGNRPWVHGGLGAKADCR